jgi:hypothetical protein
VFEEQQNGAESLFLIGLVSEHHPRFRSFLVHDDVLGGVGHRIVLPDVVVEPIVVVLVEGLVDADPLVELLEVESG